MMFGFFGPPSIERLKKKKAFPELRQIVESDGDPKRRADALAALGDLADAPPLERMLVNGPMKEEAAAALERMNWKARDGKLAAQFHMVRKEWQKAAAIGHAAVDPLYECAMSNDNGDAAAALATVPG